VDYTDIHRNNRITIKNSTVHSQLASSVARRTKRSPRARLCRMRSAQSVNTHKCIQLFTCSTDTFLYFLTVFGSISLLTRKPSCRWQTRATRC